MEKTILNKSNSLLKSIDNMFKSVFGEREYEDEEKKQINSKEDILNILMNDGNDSKNANNDDTKDKEIEILLSGLKEAEEYKYLIKDTPSAEKRGKTFNINMSDKAGKGTRKPQPQEHGKEKDKGSQQKADKEIGDN